MTQAKPYQIRGTLQTILALRVDRPDDPGFFDHLRDDVLRAPGFFKNAPIILDVQAILAESPLDLRKFVARVRACELQPIGLMNGDGVWNDAARGVGLSVLAAGTPAEVTHPAPAPAAEPEPTAEPAPGPPSAPASPPPTAPRNLLVEQAVRGGQQVYAAGGDVVCLAPVSNGAEVIAAGHIHVYAPLRGRVFAGFEGDRRAMIFCDRLEAELVSIAGEHLVSDDFPAAARGKRVRVRLDSGGLVVDVMN
jgi:septum site-determining protein MinC